MALWTPEEENDVGLEWEEFRAKHPDRSFESYRHKRRAFAKNGIPLIEQEWFAPEYVDCERLEGDCIVTGDWHVPFADWDLLGDVPRAASKFNVRQLVIAGDIFDFNALSYWVQEDDEVPSMETEMKLVEQALARLLKGFAKIILVKGNHEQRLIRSLNTRLEWSRMQRMFTENTDRIIFSAYPYCIIDTETGPWRATHPKNYSQVKGSVAVRLSDVHSGQNIINHHGHFAGMAFAKDGERLCVDNGCCANPDKVAYKKMNDTTHPEWNEGWGMLKDGTWFPRTKNPRMDILGWMLK